MEGLTLQAQETRRNYKRQYRMQNREKVNRQQRTWRASNPEKVKEYQKRYWEKKARNLRASWEDYGIDEERFRELCEVVKAGEHADIVRLAAYKSSETIAEHLLLSVTQNKSYDALEKMWARGEIDRVPYGKTDFYGIRRLFFHYLNSALEGGESRMNKNDGKG